jgi:hypothetical protein
MKPAGVIIASVFATVSLLSVCSCSNRISVANLQSTSFDMRRNAPAVYENEDLRVTYAFWAKYGGGVMSFQIYNKRDVPVTIDWQASGLVVNDQSLPYWLDETTTQGTLQSVGYSYRGLGVSTSQVTTTFVRPEKISVIPPHASITREEYTLVPRTKRLVPKSPQTVAVPLPADSSKTVRAKGQNYSQAESPRRYRNYFSYSLNENAEGQLRRIDNEFYISSLWEVKNAAYFKLKDNSGFYMR